MNNKLETIFSTLVVLRHNLHTYHWNIKGPDFIGIHKLLESQYTNVLEFIDRIAEYIRTTGEYINITLTTYVSMSKIDELVDDFSIESMIPRLIEDLQIIESLISGIKTNSKALDNILGDLDEFISKQRWFYQSYNI